MTMRALKLVGASAIVAAMAGCGTASTTSQVAGIVQQKMGYLQSNFSPDHLPKSLTQPPAGVPVDLHFQKLVVNSDVTITKVGNSQVERFTIELTLINAGNGWIEQMTQWSSNDIPYALNSNLNFMGIFGVRSQYVGFNDARPGAMWGLGSITALDRNVVHPQENAQYFFSGSANGKNYTADCKSDKYYDASGILPTLNGQALKMVCTYSTNGIIEDRATYAYLAQYGMYIPVGRVDSNSTTDDKITGISSQ